jgi:molybdopterin-containing oxidoreductase family membrane subunit
MSDKIVTDLYPRKFGPAGLIWTFALLAVCAIGAYAYYRQLRYGLVVTAMGIMYRGEFIFRILYSLSLLVL